MVTLFGLVVLVLLKTVRVTPSVVSFTFIKNTYKKVGTKEPEKQWNRRMGTPVNDCLVSALDSVSLSLAPP